ncbi:MAG: WGR domain-containing protein [bacterium]
MQPALPDPVHLTRVDASQNMARFYGISLQPTLFGEVAVLRQWGRIGTTGQCLAETFADLPTAAMAQDRLQRIKRRRGYAVVSPAGTSGAGTNRFRTI